MPCLTRILIAAAVVPLATAALAEPPRCLPRADLVTALETQFAESAVGMGLESEASVVEIFRSDDGGSWTILQSFSNGMSCIVATGTDWVAREPLEVAGVAS